MRHAERELADLVERCLEPRKHPVDGCDQPPELIGHIALGDPLVEVLGRNPVGEAGDLADRPQDHPRHDPASGDCDEEDHGDEDGKDRQQVIQYYGGLPLAVGHLYQERIHAS